MCLHASALEAMIHRTATLQPSIQSRTRSSSRQNTCAHDQFCFASSAVALVSAFMSAMDKLERRLGFIAVPGLLRYVAALTALVFILYKIDARYLTLINLDVNAVLHGQVWRLITYIFIPQLGSLI